MAEKDVADAETLKHLKIWQ